jgi:hypothetical protein
MNVLRSPVFAGLLSPCVFAGPVVRDGAGVAFDACCREMRQLSYVNHADGTPMKSAMAAITNRIV